MLETNLLGPVRSSMAFLPHMTERGSGHIINAVSYGGLLLADPMTIPYDSGHAALATFTQALAQQSRGSGVTVSVFCPGSRSPRIGQNTRSRGMGRWLGDGLGAEEGTRVFDQLAASLIDALHHPRFLIVGDAAEAGALRARWDTPAPAETT
jgi:NAD(P)-dependent dehydrogenase (short-subunit alcohol dehydrogenase family)